MKKSFYILASALVLFACQKQEVINNEEVTPNPTEEENIFSLCVSMPETRTNIAGADDVQFEKDETLAIIADGDNIVTLTAQSTGRAVTFQGNIGANTISDGATIVYPASFLNASKKVVYPASGGPSHVVPMAGTVVKTEGEASATTANATLKHIGGIVKVAIADMPSIATAFTFSAKNNGSAVAITGTYDLSFNSDGEPELSNASSTGTLVSFSVTGGENEFYVPIPDQECDELTVNVMEGANTLFTKTSTRGESTFGERASFLGLKEVSINPTVYLYSHMTGWEGTNDAPMTYSSGAASLKLSTIGGQYFRVKVAFPTGVEKIFGPSTADVTDKTSGTFSDITSAESKKAVKISDGAGVYTLSFDITDNSWSIKEATGESFHLYIRGEFNEWSFTSGIKEMIHAGNKVYYYIGKMDSEMKLFYNKDYNYSQIGGSTTAATGDLVTETGSTGVIDMGKEWPFILVANFDTNKFVVQNLGDDTGDGPTSSTSVRLCYNNHWESSGQLLSAAVDQAQTYHTVMTMSGSPAEMRLYIDNNYWGNELSNWVYVETGSGKTIDTWYSNWQIKNGTYIFAFNLKNHKYFAYDIN